MCTECVWRRKGRRATGSTPLCEVWQRSSVQLTPRNEVLAHFVLHLKAIARKSLLIQKKSGQFSFRVAGIFQVFLTKEKEFPIGEELTRNILSQRVNISVKVRTKRQCLSANFIGERDRRYAGHALQRQGGGTPPALGCWSPAGRY